MSDLLTALGLAIAIEGALYTLFPNAMKTMMVKVLEQPLGHLRMAGLAAAFFGVAIVWMVRG